MTSDTVSQKAFSFPFPPLWYHSSEHQLLYRICTKCKREHNPCLLTRAAFTGRHGDVSVGGAASATGRGNTELGGSTPEQGSLVSKEEGSLTEDSLHRGEVYPKKCDQGKLYAWRYKMCGWCWDLTGICSLNQWRTETGKEGTLA